MENCIYKKLVFGYTANSPLIKIYAILKRIINSIKDLFGIRAEYPSACLMNLPIAINKVSLH